MYDVGRSYDSLDGAESLAHWLSACIEPLQWCGRTPKHDSSYSAPENLLTWSSITANHPSDLSFMLVAAYLLLCSCNSRMAVLG